MESISRPKKPGAARTGVVAASLLLVLILVLPGVWYAAYRDQLATPAGPRHPGAAPLSRPSGVVSLAPSGPGKTRTVQIQHTGGQVITTINDGHMTMTMRGADPHPPANSLDALGQSLCDRYNAWKCARGDPRQPANVFQMPGRVSVTFHITPNPGPPAGVMFILPTINMPALPSHQVHAPGTRAP